MKRPPDFVIFAPRNENSILHLHVTFQLQEVAQTWGGGWSYNRRFFLLIRIVLVLLIYLNKHFQTKSLKAITGLVKKEELFIR